MVKDQSYRSNQTSETVGTGMHTRLMYFTFSVFIFKSAFNELLAYSFVDGTWLDIS